MPIYEYECNCCPSRFELKRSFDDDSPVSCPQCEGGARRVFSAVPVIFKGSGFYVTDSRGTDTGSLPGGGDGDGDGNGDGNGDGKKDSVPEAKTASAEEAT